MPKSKTVKKPAKRNYRKEYDRYQGTPKQIKRRAGRVKARRAAIKDGSAKKGDGKDVHHKDGNPKNNAKSNRVVKSKSANRSFPRTKKAGKK